MRLSALAILNTALEVGGASLGDWPELREGVRDEGCRYLFQVCLCVCYMILMQIENPAHSIRLSRSPRSIPPNHINPLLYPPSPLETPTRALPLLPHRPPHTAHPTSATRSPHTTHHSVPPRLTSYRQHCDYGRWCSIRRSREGVKRTEYRYTYSHVEYTSAAEHASAGTQRDKGAYAGDSHSGRAETELHGGLLGQLRLFDGERGYL